jgi:hypothetical protein
MELTRQLGDSGLTEQLPAILAQAEQEVKALQAAVAELSAADPSTKTVFEFRDSRFTDVPTLLLYKPEVTKDCAKMQSPLLEFATDLLDIVVNMHLLAHPYLCLQGLVECMLPAGRLAVATLQCLSTCLNKLPAQAAVTASSDLLEVTSHFGSSSVGNPIDCRSIAWSCITAADYVAQGSGSYMRDLMRPSSLDEYGKESNRPPSKHGLKDIRKAAAHLTDPCVLECLFTTVLAGLHGAGGSSKGVSSGNSSAEQQRKGVADYGASTTMASSQCYAQTLLLLGYSRKALEHLSDQGQERSLACSCCCFMSQYTRYTNSMSAAAAKAQLQQTSIRHQALHLLLPPLLLAWAASAQHDSTDWVGHNPAGPGSDLMHIAASCSTSALRYWASLQQRQQQRVVQETPQVPAGIAGPLLRDLLPRVLDMLSDAVSAAHPAAEARTDAACDLLSWLLQHTPATAQHSSTLPALASSRPGAALLAAAAWRKHAPKLSTVLEALVRSGGSLEPILHSSALFATQATHILMWWGGAGRAAMTQETSAQTACDRQGSCLQLLLDAAVAAKSSEAQTQHCSLLASLLKHSSAALVASCSTQPFQFRPAAGAQPTSAQLLQGAVASTMQAPNKCQIRLQLRPMVSSSRRSSPVSSHLS